MRIPRGLLDTSVFVAEESGRDLRRDLLPEDSLLSVVTLAELKAGVLAARGADIRARRFKTVERLSAFELIDIDAAVATEWARLRAHLAESGRRVGPNDLWIAATAAAINLPLFTQDDDFEGLASVRGVRVVRV